MTRPAESSQPTSAAQSTATATAAATAKPSTRGTASPLKSRDFALLIAGQGISLFGDATLSFAMAMWVLDRTGSATVFASILAAAVVPTIVCSPFGGVLADRMNRRTIMVALDAGRAVIVAISAVVFASAGFSIAAVAVMQILLAVLEAFETPTVQAAIPQMYRRYGEETVRQATAVTNQVQMLCNLLPSFLGGVLYSTLGIRAMMAIAVASFAAAAVLERFIRIGAPERDGALPSPFDDFKAGLRFLLRERPNVFTLALFAAGLNFVVIGYSNVGVAYTIRTVLGFDATVYGVADGMVGVAGVAGAIIAGIFAAKLSMDRMPAALVAFTLTLLPQGLVFLLPVGVWTKLVVMVAFECASMVCCCFTNLIAAPAIQMSTPEAMTGKVMSIFGALCICAQPLGQMAYGWAYDRFPVAAILLVTTAACGAVTAMMTPFSRRFDE